MAPFRLESIFIIYPKSQHTLVQFGLNDETFTIPDYKIPTRIYRDVVTKEYYSSIDDDNAADNNNDNKPVTNTNIHPINPIKNGRIVDIDAFLQFLKLIYTSILTLKSKENPNAFDSELANIPLLLITHHSWSHYQLERITQFIYETLKLNTLVLLPVSLASAYALVSLQNCCVIDIGTEHTDIIPVTDYTPLNYLAMTLPYGGDFINKSLKEKYLPQLSWDQLEILKRSKIFEVLSTAAMERKNKMLGRDDLLGNPNGEHSFGEENVDDDDDDDALNVVDIVTSGRDTREILEERERKKKEKHIPNVELDYNYFWDSSGNKIKVGKQRFQGCYELIAKISNAVGLVLGQIEDISKAKAVWENIVVVGGTSMIRGFKESLVNQLIKDHLVTEPLEERQRREEETMREVPSGYKRKSRYPSGGNFTSSVQNIEYIQAPQVIKLPKYPDYFPEWKKNGFAEIPFLGGQIVSKQMFTHSRDVLYITRENYSQIGPSCIWDTQF